MENPGKTSAEVKAPSRESFVLAGVAIHNLSFAETVGRMREFLLRGGRGYVVTPNASHICMLQEDRELREIYENASFVLADGMSIVFASRLLGSPLPERCSGADLFTRLCEVLAPLKMGVFLLGGQGGAEKIAEAKLRREYPGLVVHSYSPPFGFENDPGETAGIIDLVNRSGAQVLFVFVGTPKSERWIYRNFAGLRVQLALSLGQALSFYTGSHRRAPRWMQRVGLEWFYRLCQEPGRLWKRYLIGNTRFLFLVAKQFFKRGEACESKSR